MALIRLAKHFLSLSPIFEVFSTQIYSQAILSNLTFGGARYIATGRGFATTRISFAILYSRFAGPSIYMGMRILLMLLYITMALWLPHLIYFWVSVMALCIAPFVLNPHQFSVAHFIITTGNSCDGCRGATLGPTRTRGLVTADCRARRSPASRKNDWDTR